MEKESKKQPENTDSSNEKLLLSVVICSDCLYDKPFYMTSRSGNKADYNPFGYNEYKQYDI